MPQRNKSAWSPGSVKKACPGCGQPIVLSQQACTTCWRSLPLRLKDAWKDARSQSGAVRDEVAAEIDARLRKTVAP